jgi:hypothetical protein
LWYVDSSVHKFRPNVLYFLSLGPNKFWHIDCNGKHLKIYRVKFYFNRQIQVWTKLCQGSIGPIDPKFKMGLYKMLIDVTVSVIALCLLSVNVSHIKLFPHKPLNQMESNLKQVLLGWCSTFYINWVPFRNSNITAESIVFSDWLKFQI